MAYGGSNEPKVLEGLTKELDSLSIQPFVSGLPDIYFVPQLMGKTNVSLVYSVDGFAIPDQVVESAKIAVRLLC